MSCLEYDVEQCRILQKNTCGEDTFDLWLAAEKTARSAEPGQFVHLLVPGKPLRRPISICEIDAAQGALRLVFQVRGQGTAALAQVPAGGELNLLGPLGHGFTLPAEEKNPVFVGGGIGVPPLLEAAKRYGERARVILGFRSKAACILEEDFRRAGCRVTLMTDDGSAGSKGLVTEPLEQFAGAGQAGMIFACGPTPMLKGVAAIAAAHNVPCQVSLEERMGCGVGACLVCACKVTRADAIGGYAHVCKDGPVFKAGEVVW